MTMEEKLRFEDLPRLMANLIYEVKSLRQELNEVRGKSVLPKTLSIKQASEFTGKSQPALRNHIYAGNLKSIRNGNRHYFDREYLEKWLRGEPDEHEEIDITEHVIFKVRKSK